MVHLERKIRHLYTHVSYYYWSFFTNARPQVYIPCMLFVVLSWTSFIIDPQVRREEVFEIETFNLFNIDNVCSYAIRSGPGAKLSARILTLNDLVWV